MTAPTPKAVALAAARYAVTEFRGPLESYLGHEDELAAQWLAMPSFVCTVQYTIGQVMARAAWNKHMQAAVAEYGLDRARGLAAVAGRIVGEWAGGRTTIDRELETYG